MENKLSSFRQYIQQNPLLIVILMISQLLFIIIIIITINYLNTNKYNTPVIQVSSIKEQLNELPPGSVEKIETTLYGTITNNHGTLQSIENSDAIIREGSLVSIYFEKIDMHYINFIVDIPSIEQSYQIFTEWSDDDNNEYYLVDRTTLVLCPTQDQMIFDNFECQDGSTYQNQGQSFIVSEFINKFDFDYFTPFVNTLDKYLIDINPISFKIDNNTKASYIEQTKDAIRSLGISPDIFNYRVIEPEDLTYFYDGD